MPDFRPHADTSRHPGRQIRYSDTIKTGGKGTGSLLNDIDSVLATPPEGRPERPKSIFDKGGMMYSSPEDLAAYDRAEKDAVAQYGDAGLSEVMIEMERNRVNDLKDKTLDIGDFSSYEVGSQSGTQYFPHEFARRYDNQQRRNPHVPLSEISSLPNFNSNLRKSYNEIRSAHENEGGTLDLFSPLYDSDSPANEDALNYQAQVIGNRRVARGYGGQSSEYPFEND